MNIKFVVAPLNIYFYLQIIKFSDQIPGFDSGFNRQTKSSPVKINYPKSQFYIIMKKLPTNNLIIILLIAICHVFTFCARQTQPQVTRHSVATNKSINSNSRAANSGSIERYSKGKLQEYKNSDNKAKAGKENSLADKVIATAMEYLGTPHCMGGTTTRCIDCSGLVMVVFEEHGISLPHNSQEQSKFGTMIKDRKDLREGDLVFFTGTYKTKNYITHSGIYTGDNKFIHTSTGKGVTITSLDDSWWKGKYVFGTRIIR